MKKDEIARHEKLILTKPVILVTTYNMMFRSTKDQEGDDDLLSDTIRLKKRVKELEWGLCILDEVHVATCRQVQGGYHGNQVALQAGPHRYIATRLTLQERYLTLIDTLEDNKIQNLEYLIGPKLHEENWKDLEMDGFLARALCVEIRCEMPPLYRQQCSDNRTMKKVYEANPEKLHVLQYIIRHHELRKDKVRPPC